MPKGGLHNFYRHPEMNELLYILRGTAGQWVEKTSFSYKEDTFSKQTAVLAFYFDSTCRFVTKIFPFLLGTSFDLPRAKQ